jgi:hypothetical protein
MMRARAEAMLRVCFAAEPPEDGLALLGDRDRWLLYRSMVRTRIVKVVRSSLPRTREILGEEAMKALVDAWLESAPPSTRYFWQLPLSFGAFAEGRLPDAPPFVADLLRYELARWRVRHAEAPAAPVVVDFTFDRAPVLNPSLVLHTFAHPVHLTDLAKLEAAQPTRVAIFRGHDHRADAVALNATAGALVEDWLGGERSVAESVRAIAKTRGLTLDQGFIEKLGSLLADFIERGMLLGSRG